MPFMTPFWETDGETMDLKDYRLIMDEIDDSLIDLFRRRMELAGEIAQYKKEHDLPILDAGRERAKVKELCAKMPPELHNHTAVLYSSLFELSRSYQARQMERFSDLNRMIAEALEKSPAILPQEAVVGVWGGEPDLTRLACEKLFALPSLMHFSSPEAVLSGVRQGLCTYGVLPLEGGSGQAVYDAVSKNGFFIVRSVRLRREFHLLTGSGVGRSNIKRILVPREILPYCGAYLRDNPSCIPWDRAEDAAVQAAKPGNKDTAAILPCAYMESHGLKALDCGVQDKGLPEARFLCVSKDLEIYPGSHRTVIMLRLPNRPGALYKLLARFYALGINVLMLESRRLPESGEEMLFTLELETSVYAQEFRQIICELSASSGSLAYLGSYWEVAP